MHKKVLGRHLNDFAEGMLPHELEYPITRAILTLPDNKTQPPEIGFILFVDNILSDYSSTSHLWALPLELRKLLPEIGHLLLSHLLICLVPFQLTQALPMLHCHGCWSSLLAPSFGWSFNSATLITGLVSENNLSLSRIWTKLS
jgi:hypothetical protein